MKTPQKSNEDIRSDGDAFIDAYLRARDELGRLDGVVAVGFGRKEVVDKLTADLSITAFVLEKIPDSEIPPDQQVPPTFEGYRTDVRVVPDITPAKCDNEDKYDSIEGGIQIQARNENSSFSGDDGKGTLGCIVRKRGNDKFKNHYLLTADHVLNTDNARRGGLVHHPYAPPAGDTTGSQVIAFIEDYGWRESVDYTAHRPSGEEFPMSGYIDCGIARLDLESRCCGIACSADNVQFDTTITDLDPDDATNNTIADVRDLSLDFAIAMPLDDIGTATDANRVVKVGRTTGRTVGIVTAVNSAALDGGDIIAGLLEVEFDPASTTDGVNCKGNALFIEGGDSGALVLDMNNNAVGLAFGTKTRPDDGRISCFACHIVAVLDTLRISIPTTGGTSHGSTLATDGSGIARYGGSIADVSDSGNVLFSSQAVAGTLKSASPAYPPREL
ncbi:MAG: S1 family peptidase, partial [Gammaproteobacteria bacterium]|nr:S1 family peptidase [Gammaproteobacteria bacterium]